MCIPNWGNESKITYYTPINIFTYLSFKPKYTTCILDSSKGPAVATDQKLRNDQERRLQKIPSRAAKNGWRTFHSLIRPSPLTFPFTRVMVVNSILSGLGVVLSIVLLSTFTASLRQSSTLAPSSYSLFSSALPACAWFTRSIEGVPYGGGLSFSLRFDSRSTQPAHLE